MTLKTRARYVIGAILAGGVVVLVGLYFFAEQGQFLPAGMTGGSTMADQRDSAVSNNVANHKK